MTATPELEKAITLIKKLLAKAASAEKIGNAHEAAAFAAKANELLLKHKLEMTEVEAADLVSADDVIGQDWVDSAEAAGMRSSRSRSAWLESLASGIVRAHFCRILVVPGSKQINFVGKSIDRQLAVYLFRVLAANGHRLATLHERKVRTEAARRGWPMPERPRNSFLLGYVAEIQNRLAALRAEVEKRGGQHAVVRFDAATKAVDAWLKANIETFAAGGLKRRVHDAGSYDAGKKAGKEANLNPGIGGGAPSSRGTIGAGQLLIKGGK